jgi:hypothetical protein
MRPIGTDPAFRTLKLGWSVLSKPPVDAVIEPQVGDRWCERGLCRAQPQGSPRMSSR